MSENTNKALQLNLYRGVNDYIKWDSDDKDVTSFIDELCKLETSTASESQIARLAASLRNNEYIDDDTFYRFIRLISRIGLGRGVESNSKIAYMLHTIFPKNQIINNVFIFFGMAEKMELENADSLLEDVFSKGQLKSKFWLIEELKKLELAPDYIFVLGAWFGQLIDPLHKHIGFKQARSVDIDETSCFLNDFLFNSHLVGSWTSKSVCADINELECYSTGYYLNIKNRTRAGNDYRYDETQEPISEKFLPDLIINTSAEHMTTDWFYHLKAKKMQSNPIVAIQSNNFTDVPEHINAVTSLNELKKKYKFKKILFEGELDLGNYTRYMLIGKLN